MTNRITGPFIAFFIIVGIGVLSPLFVERFSRKPLPQLGVAPSFALTDSTGSLFSSDKLKNRIWITSFFFTSCEGPCPLMNAELAKLHQAVKARGDVHLVSISVDPARDVPSALANYAEKHNADITTWHFLTGDKETVKDIGVQGFKVGSGDDALLHTTRFILVDREGKIRGYYLGTDQSDVEKLKRDLASLW